MLWQLAQVLRIRYVFILGNPKPLIAYCIHISATATKSLLISLLDLGHIFCGIPGNSLRYNMKSDDRQLPNYLVLKNWELF
jgi:hypothetical protein